MGIDLKGKRRLVLFGAFDTIPRVSWFPEISRTVQNFGLCPGVPYFNPNFEDIYCSFHIFMFRMTFEVAAFTMHESGDNL